MTKLLESRIANILVIYPNKIKISNRNVLELKWNIFVCNIYTTVEKFEISMLYIYIYILVNAVKNIFYQFIK